MMFPTYLSIGPFLIHPHWIFESLSYLVGFRLYLWRRARAGDVLAPSDRWWVITAAIVGAAVGSKVFYWLGDPFHMWAHRSDLMELMAGKTIVGGLLGGLIGVEWIKRRVGIRRATGDLFAIPLAVGIAVGRVGCFLSGLGDHTYGLPTRLPWGVDFGDGIPRHPTQLYEMLWLAGLVAWLRALHRRPHREGDEFKTFMVGYLEFRFFLEFLKPGVPLAGLTAIQWACAGTLVYYRKDLLRLLRPGAMPAHG